MSDMDWEAFGKTWAKALRDGRVKTESNAAVDDLVDQLEWVGRERDQPSDHLNSVGESAAGDDYDKRMATWLQVADKVRAAVWRERSIATADLAGQLFSLARLVYRLGHDSDVVDAPVKAVAGLPLLDNPKAMRLHLVNLGDLLEGARSIYASGSRRGHGSAHGDKVDAIVLQALNWADAAANCLTEEECATAGGLGWAHERYLDDTPGDREKETTDENT